MKPPGGHRAYHPGEDMVKFRAGTIVCQATSGRPKGHLPICAKDVTKAGRYNLAGGWHDVYDCTTGHRFGIKTAPGGARSVVDISREKPTFGGSLPF